MIPSDHPIARFWRDYRENWVAVLALAVVVIIVLAALLAPWIAPQNPYDLAGLSLMDARRPPGHVGTGGIHHWLGTDASGRDLLLAAEEQLAASVGSACHSESDSVSGVLAAMGLSTRQAIGAVRLSVGRYSTEDEIAQAAQALIAGWKRVRMVQGAVQEL